MRIKQGENEAVRLQGENFRLLRDALLKAFDAKRLRAMVRIGLDEDLQTIVSEGSLQAQVEELLFWAEDHDRLPDLIAAAREANPTNLKLQEAEAAILKVSGDTAVPRPAVLFDQSHGQAGWWWLPPTVGRGYKVLAENLKGNYDVAVLHEGEQLTRAALKGFDLLVLGIGPENKSYLTKDEQEAIHAFVDNGGGLLVLGDYTGDWHHEANFNTLIERYGVFLERNIVFPETLETPDRTAYQFSSNQVVTALPVVDSTESEKMAIQSALLADVRQVATLTACSLYVDPGTAVTLLQATQAQVKEPIPFKVTIKIDGWRPAPSEHIVLAAACTSAKVIVVGSRKMFLNDFVTAEAFDNLQLFINIMQWLAA